MIVLGVTGTLGAGKGTVSEYLTTQKGFTHYSVRELLIKEIKKRKLEVNRNSMVEVANDLRAKNGASFLVDELYKKAIKTNKNIIIESIRNPEEAESLKKKENFYLLAVDANPKTRFERIKKRGSDTDNVTYKEFVDQEKRELESDNPTAIHLLECIKMADFKIENNGSLENLHKDVEKIITEIENKKTPYHRPSWDEYFMEVTNAIAKRATCDRGRSGCVIAKDNQILVTGYVGSPVGFPHCDEVGHQMKKMLHEDGSITQHCVRTVHAEQNAICQAAKRGVALNGATVYCKMTPCRTCAMLIINCGIERVYCEKKYHAGVESEQMFATAGIKLEYKLQEVEEYKNQ